jgi:hypothetical protein
MMGEISFAQRNSAQRRSTLFHGGNRTRTLLTKLTKIDAAVRLTNDAIPTAPLSRV